jgi:phosphoesterase RecJ-like protein
MSAIVRATETGSKMSVRAIPGYDASEVCARFGGGGHKGAAGASLDVPPTEAAQLLKPLLISAVS